LKIWRFFILAHRRSVGRFRLAAAAIAVMLLPTARADSPLTPISVDLHPYGFPTALDTALGLVYLSKDRLAVLFDEQLPGTGTHSHVFQLMIVDATGHAATQLTLHNDPKAMDVSAGPSGGVIVGQESHLDFYDSELHLLRSVPLTPTTTAVRFNRELNQLVVSTVERGFGHRTAHFLDGDTLQESATLTYPIQSIAIFGRNELVYTSPGYCKGSAHIESKGHNWSPLDKLPACDALTFIAEDRLAYAFDERLYLVDSSGKELLIGRIPVPDTFQAPMFRGLSEDHTRLAISALKRKNSSGWPVGIFVYDLISKRLIFSQTLRPGSIAAALSPDGHQVATIDHGALLLAQIP
jgi:hypothetical protein